jgi:hypothetical protein
VRPTILLLAACLLAGLLVGCTGQSNICTKARIAHVTVRGC